MIYYQPDISELPYAIEIEHEHDYEHRFYVTIYHDSLEFGRVILPEIATPSPDIALFVIRYELHRVLKHRVMTLKAYKELRDIIYDMMSEEQR